MKRGISIVLCLSIAFFARGQNVGVGIAAPNDLFQVYGTGATMGILFNNVTTGSTAANGLSITIDATKNILFNQQEAASMQFLTSNALRMTISAAGNVGINAVPAVNEQLIVSSPGVNSAGMVGAGNGGASGFPAGATGIGVMGVVGNGNPNVGVAGYHGAAINVGAKGAGIFGTSDIATGYGIYGFNSAANGTAGYFNATGAAGNAIIVPSGGGSVGIGTVGPDASSILDMSAISTKGMLIPKVALTATNAAGPIVSPATSLLVYNTATAGASPFNVTPGFYYNAGTPVAPNWEQLVVSGAAISGGWLTTGNSSTAPGTFAVPGANFLGTIDNFDFAVRTNNTERMRFASAGTIGINVSPVANYQVDVAGSTTSGTGAATIYASVSASLATGGAGVVGVASGSSYPATFNGNAGILGAATSAANNAGVVGYSGTAATFSKPKTSGVYGESTFQGNPGVVGINTANPSITGPTSGNGVTGITTQTQSSGVFGNNSFGGAGVFGQSNSGASGTLGVGVKGLSDGNGVYGVTSATGPTATNYAGVYGQYLPTLTTGVSGMAAVVGFNDNISNVSLTYNGNIGVYGEYNNGGPATYYGIGVLGLGYVAAPPLMNGDFGVIGAITGTRGTGTGAGVAGYIGANTNVATSYTLPATNSAVYGNSTNASFWALYGSGSSSAGRGLFVNGTTNLVGVTTLGTSSSVNGSLVFNNSTNGNTVTINSGITSASFALTLPTTLPTINGQALVGTTAGVLSWSAGAALIGLTGTAPIYVTAGTTPVVSIQGVVAGDQGGVLYSTGTATSALFNPTGTAGQILLSGNTAAPTWSNIAGIVTANNGLTASGTTIVNIQLGGALTQATTITQGNFDLIANETGTGDFRVQKSGTDVFRVWNGNGQVSIGTPVAAPPNANLKMTTNGSTYSDNQVTTIPLYVYNGTTYGISNTSGADQPGIETAFEPGVFRADGFCQFKLEVYYTTSAATNNFQLHLYGNGGNSFPVLCSGCGTAWTYTNVNASGNWVATSNWCDFNPGSTVSFYMMFNAWVNAGTCNIKAVYVHVRAKNN